MPLTSTDLLATLEAERAIFATYYRFMRLCDTLQFDRVAACFTPDAHIDYNTMAETGQSFAGRDAFGEYMVETWGPRIQRQAHVAGQTTIEWNDGAPRVIGYGTAWHWFNEFADKGDLRPADWTTIGLVQDDFELHDGDWLIAHRRVSPVAGIVAVGELPS